MSTNRLEARLALYRAEGRSGVAPYVTAGDGGLETTREVLLALDRGGAACVELGVPFSDPIADGPTLQAAAGRALDAGTTLRGILEMVKDVRGAGSEMPIALFSYANPLYSMGWVEAAKASREAGVDGWLVPDMIPSQGAAMRAAANAEDLACIFFAAPTSSSERIAAAAEASRGFLYAIGRVGVTGANTTLTEDTLEFLRRLRGSCDLPIGVGFGLRNAEQVAAVTEHAELAIVGSAFVQRLRDAFESNPSPSHVATEAATYLSELQQGLRS
jgi:tryptophan synthase alpha chain